MMNFSPITLIKFCILFNTSSCFSLQFEAHKIYVKFGFDFVLDVLTVVYKPRVYLIEVKVQSTFTCFSL